MNDAIEIFQSACQAQKMGGIHWMLPLAHKTGTGTINSPRFIQAVSSSISIFLPSEYLATLPCRVHPHLLGVLAHNSGTPSRYRIPEFRSNTFWTQALLRKRANFHSFKRWSASIRTVENYLLHHSLWSITTLVNMRRAQRLSANIAPHPFRQFLTSIST